DPRILDRHADSGVPDVGAFKKIPNRIGERSPSDDPSSVPVLAESADIRNTAVGMAIKYARIVTALRSKPALKPAATAAQVAMITTMSKVFMRNQLSRASPAGVSLV